MFREKIERNAGNPKEKKGKMEEKGVPTALGIYSPDTKPNDNSVFLTAKSIYKAFLKQKSKDYAFQKVENMGPPLKYGIF